MHVQCNEPSKLCLIDDADKTEVTETSSICNSSA